MEKSENKLRNFQKKSYFPGARHVPDSIDSKSPPRNKFFQSSLCRQNADVGPCSGRFPRWFFNSKSNQCEEFTFGGCQGNGNNFFTIEECRRTCDGTIDNSIIWPENLKIWQKFEIEKNLPQLEKKFEKKIWPKFIYWGQN